MLTHLMTLKMAKLFEAQDAADEESVLGVSCPVVQHGFDPPLTSSVCPAPHLQILKSGPEVEVGPAD